MRIEEAPPAGWYPDPRGGSRLRWWEGTDWSDRYRAPPTQSEVDRRQLVASTHKGEDHQVHVEDHQQQRLPPNLRGDRQESQEIVEQVRLAARQEAERAAEMFGNQARAATRNLQPLISEYTSKIVRWLRIASVIAILLLIGWIAFQIFAQVSLFEWVGDRIDNLTDNSGVVVATRLSG